MVAALVWDAGAAVFVGAAGEAARVREVVGLRAGDLAAACSGAAGETAVGADSGAAAVACALDARVAAARVVERAAGLRVDGLRARGVAGSAAVPSPLATVSVAFGVASATTVDSTPASSDSSRLRSAAVRAVVRFTAGAALVAGAGVVAFWAGEEVRPGLTRRVDDRGALAFFSGVADDSVLSEGGRSKLTPLTYQAASRSVCILSKLRTYSRNRQ